MQLISKTAVAGMRSLWCVTAFMGGGAAQATTILPLTAQEVRERSSAVIVATVAARVVWRDPVSGTIRTDLELASVDVLWSDDGRFQPTTLTFTGGELEGLGMRIPGMPEFPVGAQALFFVEGDGQAEACPTVGWSQGYFELDGGDQLVTADGEYLASEHGRLVRTPQSNHAIGVEALREILASTGGAK